MGQLRFSLVASPYMTVCWNEHFLLCSNKNIFSKAKKWYVICRVYHFIRHFTMHKPHEISQKLCVTKQLFFLFKKATKVSPSQSLELLAQIQPTRCINYVFHINAIADSLPQILHTFMLCHKFWSELRYRTLSSQPYDSLSTFTHINITFAIPHVSFLHS